MFKYCLILLTLSTQHSFAGDLADCTPNVQKNNQCVILVKDLHPTQFAVGMLMVDQKKDELEAKSNDDFKKYLKKNPIPVVVGPGNIFYQIDHHHLARAIYEMGKSKMIAEIKENWSKLDTAQFWKLMNQSNFVYLYDAKGNGPLSPAQLPSRVEQLVDDPYRSLAAMARDEGCYEKSTQPFAEFRWAQYFRPQVVIKSSDHELANALKASLPLCHVPAARALPGYTRQ